MSAELLREAAALIRERAEAAATESDPEWFHRAQVGGYACIEPAHIGLHGYQSTAAHIASWDPTVALDVADLLERVADDYAIASHGYWSACAENIARAYLGRDA